MKLADPENKMNPNWFREKILENGDHLVWCGPDLDCPWEVIRYSCTEKTPEGHAKQTYNVFFNTEEESLKVFNEMK